MTEVEELLMRIRGLVFAQAILEEGGATAPELHEHRLETERLRRRLARVVADGAAAAGSLREADRRRAAERARDDEPRPVARDVLTGRAGIRAADARPAAVDAR